MPSGYQGVIANAEGDGTALTASTTATSIIHATGRARLAGNHPDLWKVGRLWRVRASGRITTVTTPGTLTFTFRLGPTSNIAVATSPAFALNASAKTNVTWDLEWLLRLAAKGSSTSANFMHTGMWTSEAVIGSSAPASGGSGSLLIPASAPAVGTGFDSTVENVVDLYAQWGTNNANSILAHMFYVEDLGP